MSTETTDDELTVDQYPDLSDVDAQYAVVVEGRIEHRFAFRSDAERKVAELDQQHVAATIVDAQ